jgi:glycolate oxidase
MSETRNALRRPGTPEPPDARTVERGLARLARDLARIVGPDGVVTDPDALTVYERDALTYLSEYPPQIVALPRSTEEVAAVARRCSEAGVPITPRGAGTGLAGGAVAARGGVLIGLNRMDRIRSVDLANRQAEVEAGLVNLWLTNAVRERGYFFAPDPSSQAASTIGGNIGNNAGGAHCLKYGMTVSHVLGLEVVLADGSVVHLGGAAPDPPGYDLAGVFVGSEGTFGVATAATVRLLPHPEGVKTMLAIFDSVQDASNAVAAITAEGIIPAALEMIDKHIIRAVEEVVRAGYPQDAEVVLLIELDGPWAEIEAQADAVLKVCRRTNVIEVRVAKDEQERARLWKGRKEAAGAVGRITPTYYLQDCVIRRTLLPRILGEIDAIGARHGVRIANVFHAGDGNLHPLICFDERVPGELERAVAAGSEILRLCIAVGGTVTGEHGVGQEKMNFMPLMFSEADLAAMLKVRNAFNPENRCNPGKIFPTAKTCGEVGIAYRPHPIEQQGLAVRL